ncbi:MAG: hypothetical protein QM767_27625 [Anaeromyxobacter sp.]
MTPARPPRPSRSLAPLLLALAACGGGGPGGGSPGGDQAPAGPVADVTFPRTGDGFTVQRDSTDAECAGLLPESPLPAAVVRGRTLAAGATCSAGLSEGTGHVALGAHDAAALWTWQDRDGAGNAVHQIIGSQLSPLLPEAQGWLGIAVTPAPATDPVQTPLSVDLHVFRADGWSAAARTVSPPRSFWSDRGYTAYNGNYRWQLGEDPLGGATVGFAYTEFESNPSSSVFLRRFSPDGTPLSAPVWVGGIGVIATLPPQVMATAASRHGPTLVLWNDRADRALAWYTAEGDPMGPSFTDGHTTASGPLDALWDATLQPLLDGSVALRESGVYTRVYRPGASAGEAAPAWLAALSPGAHLRFTRGNRGYAVLPAGGASATPCQQTVELRAPSGLLCGRVVVSQGAAACTTAAADQGWDGTLVVQSARDTCTAAGCTCTHRWWPALLASPGPTPPPPALPGTAGDGFAVQTLSTAAACSGLVPSGALPAQARASVDVTPESTCAGGAGDGTGHVALGRKLTDPATGRTDFTWSARDATGALAHTFDADGLSTLLPQASGWHGLAVEASGVNHKVIRADGTTARTALVAPPNPLWASLGPDPRGGSVAVASQYGGTTWSVTLETFAADGTVGLGPQTVASGTGFGGYPAIGAVARGGSTLVLWEVSPGQRWGRWYAPSGTAGPAFLDGAFDETAFPPDAQLVPLLDGTLALRDHGHWTRSYTPGVAGGGTPPGWLAGRPNTLLRFTRGNRGYAFFPAALTVEAPRCEEAVELLAPDGTACGRVTFRESSLGCATGALDQAWDGTVVRQSAREACAGGSCTCSHQWWPRLLGP